MCKFIRVPKNENACERLINLNNVDVIAIYDDENELQIGVYFSNDDDTQLSGDVAEAFIKQVNKNMEQKETEELELEIEDED